MGSFSFIFLEGVRGKGMDNAELITGLRECATVGDCSKCKMHNEYSYDMCAIKLLLAAADALEAQIPKWVSVEDRLPEESGEYIVYIQMGTGVEMPDFFGSDDLSYVTSMYFKESQKLWLDEYDEVYNADLSLVDTANDFHVTHWMPLPQKPKGEGDEFN